MTGFEAGVYDGMPEDVYHADPVPGGSLSASEAKMLLPPSCPARYWHDRCFGSPPKDAFDLGIAAHKLVLGTGPELVIIDAPDWRGREAREARDRARFEGHVALLLAEFTEIEAMALAIRKHPIASALLGGDGGKPEQSLFWQDPAAGIWCRARLDWLPRHAAGKRLIVTDYKTTAAADPAAIRKHVANYGYHQQAAWYLDGIRALGLAEDPAFVFIFQEKTPPYLITAAQLDAVAIETGGARNRLAREIWRDCTEAGYWPGYSQDIELISLPPWAARLPEEYLT